jgi:hypothetical protein
MRVPSAKQLVRRLRGTPPKASADATPPTDRRAAADELVREGRRVDAIRVLTELNRERRDPAIERQLVELRFEAFDDLAPGDDAPTWPAQVADQFPGASVPEVGRDELTPDALRSGIVNHGSLIVRGLLDPAQVERLCTAIDRSIDAYDAEQAGTADRGDEGWFEPCARCAEVDREWKRKAGAVLAVDSPAGLFELTEVLGEAGIPALAESHFGEPAMLLGLKTTLRRVSHVAYRHGDWHQDGAFMGVDIRSLNVWVALTHCGDDAPGLDIVGRRLDHLAEMGTSGALAQWSVGPAVAEAEGGEDMVRPVFEAGDALLFDHMMLHRTVLEPDMVNDRHAAEVWFLSPSTYGIMTAKDDEGHTRDQRPFWL